jgi:hypothetical protein
VHGVYDATFIPSHPCLVAILCLHHLCCLPHHSQQHTIHSIIVFVCLVCSGAIACLVVAFVGGLPCDCVSRCFAMNISPEDNGLLYVGFNQTACYVCAASTRGYSVWSVLPTLSKSYDYGMYTENPYEQYKYQCCLASLID